MINKEAIKKLQSALKQIDEAQPLCPSPGCDILSNAGMNVDLALEILKEQPPASELTKKVRENYSEDGACGKTIYKLCDCLDASEASREKLLAACETAEKELEQRYHAQEGSAIDKLVLKIVKDAIKANK